MQGTQLQLRQNIDDTERILPGTTPGDIETLSFEHSSMRVTRIPLPAEKPALDPHAYHPIHQADWYRAHLFHRAGLPRASRLFILINGLNEIENWDLYHDLAHNLIEWGNSTVACLLLPAPYHLDRYPFVSAEIRGGRCPRPLDLFFSSPIQLWRMYRSQMLEIQTIMQLVRSKGSSEPTTPQSPLISAARERLTKVVEDPRVHTVGFSLGGLAALSALRLQPDDIDGCVAVCSGAALQTLNILKLCEPEEWQNLLIFLRNHMEREVAKLDAPFEERLWRTFADTYVRTSEYAFKRFLGEFRRRVLFVVGGRDPVVPLDSVIRDTPAGGVSILLLADVPHFVTQDQSWYAWNPVTVPAILQAATIATGNRLTERLFAGTAILPQRVQDDLAYFIKLLRAAGEVIKAEPKRELEAIERLAQWHRDWPELQPDIADEMVLFETRIHDLAKCAPNIPEQNRDAILNEPPAVEFEPRTRLSALWAQLFLIARLERSFTTLDYAMFRFPTLLQHPLLVEHRLARVYQDHGQKGRYRAAIYFRKALVFANLVRSGENARFRLLLPMAFLERFCVQRPALVDDPPVDLEIRRQQLEYVALLMARHSNVEVRTVGDGDRSPLLRSFCLGYSGDVAHGLELSRVNFDSNIRGLILDNRPFDDSSRRRLLLQSRETVFRTLWEEGQPFSAHHMRDLVSRVRSA